LDNLAWVLQYEWQILAGVTEDGGRDRQACNLFGPRFLASLKSQHPRLASVLEQHGSWARELAELRDPAAHRVPIYVPPSVIASQEQIDKFRRMEGQAEAAPSERGDRPISEIYREAQAVADFAPVMIFSTPQGLEMRLIGEQVRYDHDKYLTIARAVVDALGLLPNQTLQRAGGQRWFAARWPSHKWVVLLPPPLSFCVRRPVAQGGQTLVGARGAPRCLGARLPEG
jgi:hypothetical protein